ncbi:MAG: TonB-dependent receptor [Burkholderiales bacterium PBB2]|nr:MAG: TonB-dependent receptor [Burkholderiales bacterium PBB2]
MFKKSPVGAAVWIALGGLALATSSAHAQQQLERIEVTGSSIKRMVDTDSALPISVISAADLRATGVNSAEGALAKIAASQSMTGSSQTIGSGTGGAAYANLRGLGSNKTLVLLNGRRVAAFAFSSASVDLNSIPFAAIDRVEVLRDGASAIYGTDAIGGVINFITKRDYRGIDASVNYSKPREEGGVKKGIAVSGGWGNLEADGFNVWASVDKQTNERVRAVDRDFARTGVIPDRGLLKTSGTSFPANFSQTQPVLDAAGKPVLDETGAPTSVSLSGNPSLKGCAPPFSLYLPSISTSTCRFDYTAFIDIIPDTETKTGLLKATAKVGGQYLSLEHMATDSSNIARVASDPVTGLSMPTSSPFFPKSYAGIDPTLPITVGWRMIPGGARTNQASTKANRTVISVDGSYGNWDYRAGFFNAESKGNQDIQDGYVNKSLIQKGVTEGKLNPFGEADAAALALIEAAKMRGVYSNAKGSSQGVDFNASTQLWDMAGGPVGVSVGAEFRKDKYRNDTIDSIVDNVPSLGVAPYHVSGDRKISALSTEWLFPVSKDVELTFAGRFDKYSDFGSTFNPKAAIRWTPAKNVNVRASYNTGFRAPSLDEVYGPQAVSFTGDPYDDPVLCKGGVVQSGGVESRDCGQQAQIQSGGNTELKPEKSKTFSLGLAFEPVKGLTASIDYWNIKITNSISAVSEQAIFGDPAKYASRYRRCKDLSADVQATLDRCNTPEWKNSNALGYVVALNDNLGDVKTDGFDFAAGYAFHNSFGRFQLGWEATYVRSYEYQRDKGDPFIQNVGKYTDSSPVLRWQHAVTVNWRLGDFSTNFGLGHKSGYVDQNAVEEQYFNKVKSYTLADLSVTWSGIKHTKFTVGLKNLFDTKPPFSNQGTVFQQGYDPRLTDAYGRTLLLRASLSY